MANTISSPVLSEVEDDYDYLYKYIIVGNSQVGKTTILKKWIYDEFDNIVNSTVGVNLVSKTIKEFDKVFKIYVWDTSGEERFHSITRVYYKDVVGVIVVYDMCDPKSISDINYWIENIKKNVPNAVIFLASNKIDLCYESAERNYQHGWLVANKHGVYFTDISAKSGYNIEEIFFDLTKSVYDKFGDNTNLIPGIKCNKRKVRSCITSKCIFR